VKGFAKAEDFEDRAWIIESKRGSWFSFSGRRLHTAVNKAPPLKHGIGHM
jgi:hypothetical protein